MSKPIEHLGEIIYRIKDLEPFGNRMNKKIELETPEEKTKKIKIIKIKETIRNGLDKLKIMKISIKKELDEIESKLISRKENERMERFKIEEIKELKAELKELESKLELKQKFKEPILEKTRSKF